MKIWQMIRFFLVMIVLGACIGSWAVTDSFSWLMATLGWLTVCALYTRELFKK
jgi:uncharacterized membrane protein YcaP (DUF421 family)